MKSNLRKLMPSFLFFALISVVVVSAVRAYASLTQVDRAPRQSLATDWSHKHLIFSQPRSQAQAVRLQAQRRFVQQQLRRQKINPIGRAGRLKGDWSVNLGSGASVGALNDPAKFFFNLNTANCGADYVVFNTGQMGSSTQASVMAFNQIYAGCGGSPPAVYWAYNTTASGILSGTVSTSVVLSGDGSQLAFMDTPSSGSASLVILKWVQGEGTASNHPDPPDHAYAAPVYLAGLANAYALCRATASSCMLGWHISGGYNDATSSPFYDYDNDVLYVGDAHGQIHKFTGVFEGTPAEVTTNWPVVLQSASDQVTSVVYDGVSGDVFAADAQGYLYSVSCTQSMLSVPCSTSTAPTPTTTVTQSTQLASGPGVVDGPIVDGSAGNVFVFVPEGPSSGPPSVAELPVGFTGATSPTVSPLLSPNTGANVYAGDFDENYYSSEPGGSGQTPTGNLWVCSNSVLFSLPVTSGTIGAVNFALTTTASSPDTGCSPLTEFFNANTSVGAEDSIFASVVNNSSQNYSGLAGSSDCGGAGCMMGIIVSTWQPNTAYAANQHILDSNGDEEIVYSAGTSGPTPPIWPDFASGVTGEGSVVWLDQGHAGARTSGSSQVAGVSSWCSNSWSAGSCTSGGQSYSAGDTILDNTGYIQYSVTSCTTGASLPSWNNTYIFDFTTDGSCFWYSLGPAGIVTLGVSGGSSGIIVDNSVPAGTLVGASQVYFSTLGNQTCGTGGMGGCAIQTSQ
jgi:hypothetical protein